MPLQSKNTQNLWIQPYKLVCPSINHKLLVRVRLLSVLDQCQRVPLACVNSPAGFGKSTLVVSWLQSRGLQYGWYSLDINDNDLVCFTNHLIYAIHQASDGGCPQSLQLLQQEYTNLLSLLSKAMMEVANADKHFFLVLDDVQAIKNPVILQALQHWLKLLPPQIHVVLCCQNEPPVSLAAFRVKGQLIEIGAEQLAFTDEEVSEFLAENLSFPVPKKMSIELTAFSAGWPAVLQLIVHDAQCPDDLLDASGRLGQGGYEVDDYLIHEVLYQQPDKIQRFLKQISIFEQFNPALCDALISGSHSDSLIHELEKRQLFIHRVEGQGPWFRLQDLFRDRLLKLLSEESSEAVTLLKERAVDAYLQLGLLIEAVQLALSLKQEKPVLSVLTQAGMELYRRGQFQTLGKLFGIISTENIRADSKLTLLYAWVLLATYREGEVLKLLNATRQQTSEEMIAEYSIANAQAAINGEDFESARLLAERAALSLHEDSVVSKAVTYSVLGQSALCRGELGHAISLLKEAEKCAYEHKLVQQRLWSMCLISDAYTAWGKLDSAHEVQQSAIEMAHNNCIETVPHMEFLYRNRTQLLIEQGDLTQADRLLLCSEDVIEPLGKYGLLNVHVHRGMIALWRGQLEAARKMAFQVNYLLQFYQYHTDWLAHANEFLMACDRVNILDFKPHLIWREKHLTCDANNHFYQHYQRIYAIHCYHQGEKEEAVSRLQELSVTADKIGLRPQSLKNNIQRALWLNDKPGEALWQAELASVTELKPLLSLWLASVFTDESLSRAWSDWQVWFGHLPDEVTELQESTDVHLLETLNKKYANPTDLVTPKELQVLRLIEAGLNNDEIASSMHIAVSTVKSHIRRLYRKLNITKRSQAMQIFRHL
jgi:LuxR family maltose regulon positive regulatory protein